MTRGHKEGTTEAAAGLLLERAHLLLPLAVHLGQTPTDVESTIRGSSMAPAIPGGSRLRVRLNGQRPCQVGDVVLYLAEGGYTVHRVVYRAHRRIAAQHLLTEGDARFAPDPPVSPGQVLGTVTAVEVNGQWQPLGAERVRPWHQRVARAMTLQIMMAATEVSPSAARWLAGAFLTLESGIRVVRRCLVHLLRSAQSLRERIRRPERRHR